MMAGKLFLGGVPTQPDVDALMNLEIVAGSHVTYDEIEETTGVKYRTHRFSSVVMAWRKRLFRERGLQTKARGGAIHFLTADAALDEAGVKMIRVGRATGRVVRDVGMIHAAELGSDEKRARHTLMAREAAALLEAARAAHKSITGPAPTQSRPWRAA